MRNLISVTILVAVCLIPTRAKPQPDYSGVIRRLFGFKPAYCWIFDCPPWHCQDDSTVIHGYCCHCPGSVTDNVPVPCTPNLVCPKSSEPLCTEYNFMMDCCCTGP